MICSPLESPTENENDMTWQAAFGDGKVKLRIKADGELRDESARYSSGQ